MGKIGQAPKVKLFCGILSVDEKITTQALTLLKDKFGGIDFESGIVNFDYSNYYTAEMGAGIKRFWVSFDKLVSAGDLSDIKIFANKIEDEFAQGGKRKINVDPGYVTPHNVVLASTKNFSHRIYLDKGIYAEVTTIFTKGDYIKLPWSYPDYLSGTAKPFLSKIREKLVQQLKI